MSCQDHFSASSPTRFSTVSARLLWSKTTRLLKHGIDGNEVAMVEVSWTANPWDRSSRCIRFRCPPYFGAWADEGAAKTATTTRPNDIATAKVRERFIVLLSLRRPSGRDRIRCRAGGKILAKYTAWAVVRQPCVLTRRVIAGETRSGNRPAVVGRDGQTTVAARLGTLVLMRGVRSRLLSPDPVARLVSEQVHSEPLDLALDLGGGDRAAAHDAGTAGPSVGLRDAVDRDQATLGQPGADCRLSSSSVSRRSSSIALPAHDITLVVRKARARRGNEAATRR